MRRRMAACISLLSLLALAATALALGCGRGTAGDAGPTAAPLPTRTPWPTSSVEQTAVPPATSVPELAAYPTPQQLATAEPAVRPSPTSTPHPWATPTPTVNTSVMRRWAANTNTCYTYGQHGSDDWQHVRYVDWSPDGSQILFDASVGYEGYPPVGLYGLEVESYELKEIVNPLENTWEEYSDGYYSGPMMYFDVSPDGSRVAYSTCRYSNYSDYEIMLSDIDGSNVVRLTDNRDFDNFPVWSPDGTRIAFISDRNVRVFDRHPSEHLYTMAADGSDVMLVALGTGEQTSTVGPHPPKWSPDGERLAFVVYEERVWNERRETRVGGSAVYTVGADGTGLIRIADTLSEPAWSPDGRWLAVVVPEGEHGVALYVYASDGSDSIRIAGLFTDEAEQIRHFDLVFEYMGKVRIPWMGGLSWSPDGSMILLEATAVRVSVGDGHVDYSLPLILTVANTPHVYARSEIAGRSAAWSPDGSRIAVRAYVLAEEQMGWRDFSDGSVVLYTMDREGTDLRILVRSAHTGVEESPYSIIARRFSGRPYKSLITGAWGSRFVAWNPDRPPADASACYAGYVVSEPSGNGGLAYDCSVLLGMRDTLSGSGVLGWSPDTPITEWEGVRVEGKSLRVRGLDFYGLGENLDGRIPPEVANLQFLRVLRVTDSQIDGPIPAELGNLWNLKVLDLARNQLSGPIPPELGILTKLNDLSLESNQLAGAIPAELGNLINLWELDLSQNGLTGSIPSALGNLENLGRLVLWGNRLAGNIPAELENLQNLHTLRLLGRNELTGCAPSALNYVRDSDLEHLGFCDE